MERIYVTVRARPLSAEESKTSPWKISGNSISLSNVQSTRFEFDRIFGEDCKTADVYAARTGEIVSSAVRGFNGTVFAYGQTSSGKTHTMRGSVFEPGIIPLAVHDLFRSIQEDAGREFLVRMSYMEIYNEEINDLLAPEHRKLQIHESLERGIYVAGLREEIVTSPAQVLEFMEFGESHRHIGQTNMNLYSSRSHTIFRMIIESREKPEDDADVNSCDAVRVSVLNLVDLAGSERAAKTGAEGLRLKEGSHINKSLMTLGTVIKKLSEGTESQGGHVPYRDSKLTRILQPALGGNANTAIICNITLAQIHTDETKSSLQFASRALHVTNCACVNEILTDAALLKRQRKEIEELRAKLMTSHSEHFEEEILNLRNTLLKSELEKERIALELEEEKKDRAHRERRLAEQAKKIANLSSLVLCSERDEKSTNMSKNKRRVTWCPGPFSRKCGTEVSTPNEVSSIREFNGNGQDVNMPPSFEELMQENEVITDNLHSNSCISDLSDKSDEFSLPDACALLHVTSRRKIHHERAELLQMKTREDGCESSTYKSMESECNTSTSDRSSFLSQLGVTSCGLKGLTLRESEAIHVIKHLEDQISSVEMEKTAIQGNFDDILDLVNEQNTSFKEKYDELYQDLLNARNEARVAQEQLSLVASNKLHKEEPVGFSLIDVSKEVQEVALLVDHSKGVVDSVLSFFEDLFRNFSVIPDLREIKLFSSQNMLQLESIISLHNKLQSCLKNKLEEVELEKNLLQNQLADHQKQIEELKYDLVTTERAMADQFSQHEFEKDELLGQVLNLQKEVMCLSSSALFKEKEIVRKELDKTKLKLKDMESKLRNTVQEKTKLESEKMQAEREVKHLIGQRAVLERDIRKRDSLLDRRNSKSFDSNPKGYFGVQEQNIEVHYQNLEVRGFEMEAEIASLKENLTTAVEENEKAYDKNGNLESEVNTLLQNLSAADSEINFLKEEIVKMEQELNESEACSRNLKVSLDLLTKEKEDMGMQLADALLEMEVEKSAWLSKEKALKESDERMKLSEEITKLSKDLIEVTHELESSREQCKVLRERQILIEENAEKGKERRRRKQRGGLGLASGVMVFGTWTGRLQ
ncbi:kinesin-like protein KIN-7I isoform X2 [Asparagus officinalis]|uniref:kinesin-like protein KIN-7I isoform X2 n=1 Tax=Asparagus officinalis TaxID=4686 RepID=UPI00098E4FA2|nr:kinesin-like protein KIN-7I isoform X2 [Asparagus officinalis]